MMTQSQIKSLMIPLLKEKGILYEKFLPVTARKAKAKEVVQTITSDGLETENTAKQGDFIVKNQSKAGEEYIVGAEKFKARYDFIKDLKNGWSLYQPTGKVWAIEVTATLADELGLDLPFQFIASWDAPMIVRENDFLVSQPDFSSVYRIARKEFFETYEKGKAL